LELLKPQAGQQSPATNLTQRKIMKNASNYRIEDIQIVFLNRRKCKIFKAFVEKADAFVFCGAFTAKINALDETLWQIADKHQRDQDDCIYE